MKQLVEYVLSIGVYKDIKNLYNTATYMVAENEKIQKIFMKFSNLEKFERLNEHYDKFTQLFNYNLIFSNGKKINAVRSLLLIDSSTKGRGTKNNEMKIQYSSKYLQEKTLIHFLFGKNDVIIDNDEQFKQLTKEIIELYDLFWIMGKNDHMYALCNSIPIIFRNRIPDLLSLFQLCINKYEGGNNVPITQIDINNVPNTQIDIYSIIDNNKQRDDTKFDSILTRSVFNFLKDNFKLINHNEAYKRCLIMMNYFQELTFYEKSEISYSESFSDLYKKNKRMIYGIGQDGKKLCTKFYNILLKTRDGGKFLVHKEILMFETTFFSKMFTFGGIESLSNEVLIEYFTTRELQCLLDYIYLEDFDNCKNDMKILFKLLEHSVMYFENKMKLYLHHTIEENIRLLMSDPSFNYINFISMYSSFLCKIPLEERKKIFQCFVGKSGYTYKLDHDFTKFNETVVLIDQLKSSSTEYVISEQDEKEELESIYDDIKDDELTFDKFQEVNERIKKMYGFSTTNDSINRKRKRDSDNDDESDERPKKRVKKS